MLYDAKLVAQDILHLQDVLAKGDEQAIRDMRALSGFFPGTTVMLPYIVTGQVIVTSSDILGILRAYQHELELLTGEYRIRRMWDELTQDELFLVKYVLTSSNLTNGDIMTKTPELASFQRQSIYRENKDTAGILDKVMRIPSYERNRRMTEIIYANLDKTGELDSLLARP